MFTEIYTYLSNGANLVITPGTPYAAVTLETSPQTKFKYQYSLAGLLRGLQKVSRKHLIDLLKHIKSSSTPFVKELTLTDKYESIFHVKAIYEGQPVLTLRGTTTSEHIPELPELAPAILNHIDQLIITFTVNNTVSWYNRAASIFFGNKIKFGTPCNQLWDPGTCLGCQLCKKAHRKPEFFTRSISGKTLSIQLTPLSSDKHTETSLLLSATDITDQVLREQRERKHQKNLIIQDKLATFEVLIAGIIHDIKKPTQFMYECLSNLHSSIYEVMLYVRNHSQLISPELEENETHLYELQNSLKTGVLRISDTLDDLENYLHHKTKQTASIFDLNEALRSALSLTHSYIQRKTLNFSVHYEQNLLPIRASIHQIEQMIINLIKNACEALNSRMDSIRIETFMSEAQQIGLTVSDKGQGIPADSTEIIFRPFYTTKDKTIHSGLGLTVIENILKEINGHIAVESQAEVGTKFTILLPPFNETEIK